MMDFLRNFFSTDLYVPARQLVEGYLKTIKFQAQAELPEQYDTLLKEASFKAENMDEFLKQMVIKLGEQKSRSQILKLLTIIHVFVVERGYMRDDIHELEGLDFHFILEQHKDKWFSQFCSAHIGYLIKLPSISDIYHYSLEASPVIPPNLHLTYLFRITNHVRSLLTPTLNAVNVIGRYQYAAYPQMKQLYRVLSTELVNVYKLIKLLSDQILRQYRIYNETDLRCFLKSLPELELICDKMEDLLVNKYIKWKKISCKVEYKEEKVAELIYYLDYEQKNTALNSTNVEEMNSNMGLFNK